MKTLLFLALTSSFTLAQGDLNPPPGGPTSTMKTLYQLEARTPIPRTSGSPVAGPHFIISQPGSYYLTGNITVSTGDAILITAASDVSIDLNGFTIASTLTGSVTGIAISLPPNFTRLTVRHGSIRSSTTVPTNGAAFTLAGFASGIAAGPNINTTDFFTDALISDVHVHGCAGNGISFVKDSIFENCTFRNNGGEGIRAITSSVTRCTASNNVLHGIVNGSGVITQSTATANGNSGFAVGFGIAAQCIASGNQTGGFGEFGLVFGRAINCLP
jgi:hypothetical protein